jgi:hypothetical protein
LPLYQLTREEFDIIVRTFLSVFPQVSLWRDDFYSELPVVGLVGQLALKPLDLTRIHERALHLPDWSKDPLFSTPRGLLMLYAGRLSAVPDLFGSTPLNTDNNPLIEFLAPKSTRVNSTNNTDWFIGKSLAAFYDILDKRLESRPDPLLPPSEQINTARRAGTALYHYAVAAAGHDDSAARRYETDVRALVPEVVALGEYNPKTKEKSEDQQALATLRRQQEALRQQLEEMQRRLSKLSAAEKTSDDRTP